MESGCHSANIFGVMIESNLVEGRQDIDLTGPAGLRYGQSVTDGKAFFDPAVMLTSLMVMQPVLVGMTPSRLSTVSERAFAGEGKRSRAQRTALPAPHDKIIDIPSHSSQNLPALSCNYFETCLCIEFVRMNYELNVYLLTNLS